MLEHPAAGRVDPRRLQLDEGSNRGSVRAPRELVRVDDDPPDISSGNRGLLVDEHFVGPRPLTLGRGPICPVDLEPVIRRLRGHRGA
jgi:hypothetical protein